MRTQLPLRGAGGLSREAGRVRFGPPSRTGSKANAGAGLLLSACDVEDGVGVLDGPGQHVDRVCCGQDDQIDLAAAGLFPNLLHYRQRAVSTGANHQPAASPGDVFGGR